MGPDVGRGSSKESGPEIVAFLRVQNAVGGRSAGMYAVSQDGSAKVIQQGKPPSAKFKLLAHDFKHLAWHEGSLTLAYSYGSQVEIVDLAKTSEVRFRLSDLKAKITSLSFSPDATSLLCGASDGAVYRWRFLAEAQDSEDDPTKLLERYLGHGVVVSAVTYHLSGRLFFSGDWNGALNSWLRYDSDTFAGEYDKSRLHSQFFSDAPQRVRGSRDSREGIEHLRVSPDGEYLFVALVSGGVEMWQVRGFRRRALIQAHKGLIYSMELSPDGKMLATLGRDGFVRAWKIAHATGLGSEPLNTLTQSYEVRDPRFRMVTFLDATTLVTGAIDGTLLEHKVEIAS